MHTESTARIHRFGDKVALDTESMTKTLYLTPKLAKALGNQLVKYARDCENVSFTDCKLGTKNMSK